jgi:sterol desaturase/sphingolipid hydroxylase (fatty acid hydroxylase superfamily)|tara:strand:+ start:266 stop:451 length:186 start_codon:yes stop_codon:yes gene_type:complete
MNFIKNFWDKFTGTERVEVRARNKKGHYVADDKSTPNVNEAYTTKRVKKKKSKITTQNIGE